MVELTDTEDTQQPRDMSQSQVSLSGGKNNKEGNEHTVELLNC